MHPKVSLYALFLLWIAALGFGCQSEASKTETSKAATSLSQTENERPKTAEPAAELPANAYFTGMDIEAPLAKVAAKTHRYKVAVDKGRVIDIPETGSRITIPANAFVDAQGRPVEGTVDIRFQEYHDAAEILASGIPMRMKSPDGASGYMRSAGMFDIRGEQDGQAIFIAEGQTVDVDLASYYNEPDATYDFWTFDKEKQSWMNQGPSRARKNPAKQAALRKLAQQDASAEKPIPPYRFDPKKPVLDFDINLENFPELKEMQGVLWQYAGGDPAKNPVKNPWVLKEHWDAAEINPIPESNLYQLVLKSAKREFKTVVCASQSGGDFEESMLAYRQKLSEYEANKVSREDLRRLTEAQADFVRTARLQGFGVHNYDLMVKDDDNILVNASFDFGKMIPGINKITKVYMVVDGRDVVCYPPSDWNKIRISPTAKTRMLALLPDGSYATISEKQFDAIKPEIKMSSGQPYTFNMHSQEGVIADLSQLKHIIEALA